MVFYYVNTLLKSQSKTNWTFTVRIFSGLCDTEMSHDRIFQGIVIVFHIHAIRFVGGTAKRVSSFILHGLYSRALGMRLYLRMWNMKNTNAIQVIQRIGSPVMLPEDNINEQPFNNLRQ